MTPHVTTEILSQPACWRRVGELAPSVRDLLPATGERVAIVGCGTSWFIAMSYAALREASGQGETDAFAGSEMPLGRHYDKVIAISRSGTTTEIIDILGELSDTPTVVITGVPNSPVEDVADETILLDFADEQSVVQTRFATSALTLLRVSLGEDAEKLARDGEAALEVPIDDYVGFDQISFLGRGWTIGLAQEAALKTREAAQFWAEAYPAMDYRHGPFAIAQEGRGVWMFGAAPEGLAGEVTGVGAAFVTSELDPMAHLVVAQRVAVAKAERLGLDPDQPRHLTRSIILAG